MGKILGLDLGTKTGWAVYQDGRIYSGAVDLRPRRGDSPGMRMLYLRSFLNTHLVPPDLVVYERPHLRGGHAAAVLSHLEGELLSWCATLNLTHHAVHSGTLKKFASGSGTASKEEMVRLASLAVEREVLSDDEADAIHLVRYALDMLPVETPDFAQKLCE
jgi:Holliday junction resolvasome RuvABC endonuclease subunit